MNLDEFYEEMKDILRMFDLSFHEKDKVTILSRNGRIVFIYGNKTITLDIPDERLPSKAKEKPTG